MKSAHALSFVISLSICVHGQLRNNFLHFTWKLYRLSFSQLLSIILLGECILFCRVLFLWKSPRHRFHGPTLRLLFIVVFVLDSSLRAWIFLCSWILIRISHNFVQSALHLHWIYISFRQPFFRVVTCILFNVAFIFISDSFQLFVDIVLIILR